jgi:hypothetical protein
MNETKIRNGVFLPKSILIPSNQNQFLTQRQRLLQKQLGNVMGGGGGGIGNGGPPHIDWFFLFNLAVFVLFICSIFYICLDRYRNKERLKREKEYKQQMLVLEFKKLLEEKQAELQKQNQTQTQLPQQQNFQMPFEDTRNMMLMNNDISRLTFDNPYLLKY